jgi:uncharacterized protein (DUF433 family)
MTIELKPRDLAAEIDELRNRLQQLEGRFTTSPLPLEPGSDQPREGTVPGWQHLVVRRHPWRRQLYLKGRNLTVRQMVGTVKANGWSEDDAARNLDLPVEAVREALRYAEQNQELLNFETAYEHLLLAQKGYRRASPPLPR